MNSNLSAFQSLLVSETLDINALRSTEQQYEKDKMNCMATIKRLVADRSDLENPNKEQIDSIDSEIDFYKKLKIEVTNDTDQLYRSTNEGKEF